MMEVNSLMLTDEDLVRSFSEGDNGAFETLLMRHKDRVYTYIFNIVHEPSIADDIFQDTFIKVITTLKQGRYYDAGNKFVGWVMRIAHNQTIDYYRRLASDKEVSNDGYEAGDLFNEASLLDYSAQDAIEREEVFRDIETLISMLPDDQRRIVMMRYYQDLSFKEIADLEHISINTALGRMRYALINMRKNAVKHNLVRDLEKIFD
ncbi:MAG: sigma-70 family RNA polymerase sigma factor [Paludibacteraceae bacterium]|nr:sigma-70 family RNA polymerase sigma factor [Paludibacteraceae bacterium]